MTFPNRRMDVARILVRTLAVQLGITLAVARGGSGGDGATGATAPGGTGAPASPVPTVGVHVNSSDPTILTARDTASNFVGIIGG